MAANKKPRKAYSPLLLRAAHATTPHSMFRLGFRDQLYLKLRPHLALRLLEISLGDKEKLFTLEHRIGIVRHAAPLFEEESELTALAEQASRAVLRVIERHHQQQAWGLSGEDLKALGKTLNISDNIQDTVPRQQLLRAAETSQRELLRNPLFAF